MDSMTLAGVWIAGLLTLAIFSFLYRDNPWYKFAEHLYIGVSAGYWMVMDYQNVLVPNLFDRLASAGHTLATRHEFSGDWWYLIPALLGLLLLLRLTPRLGWLSRLPLAFSVGIFAGFSIVYNMQAQILEQLKASIVPLWVSGNPVQTAMNLIMVIGVCATLLYFYFSMEHKGLVLKTGSRIGILVLMVSFGAAFGYTVMGRVSILIGRMLFIQEEWWQAILQTMHQLAGH